MESLSKEMGLFILDNPLYESFGDSEKQQLNDVYNLICKKAEVDEIKFYTEEMEHIGGEHGRHITLNRGEDEFDEWDISNIKEILTELLFFNTFSRISNTFNSEEKKRCSRFYVFLQRKLFEYEARVDKRL